MNAVVVDIVLIVIGLCIGALVSILWRRRKRAQQSEPIVASRTRRQAAHAIKYYTRQLTAARKRGDRPAEGKLLERLGNVHYTLEQMKQAAEHYQQS